MAGPCLLSDGQSFSSGGGNAPGQSGGWNAVVSEHIHRTVQPAAPAIRAPVQWPLQILDRRGERQWLLADRVRVCALESGSGETTDIKGSDQAIDSNSPGCVGCDAWPENFGSNTQERFIMS